MQTPRLSIERNPTEPRMAPTKVLISCLRVELLSAIGDGDVEEEARSVEVDDVKEANVGKASEIEVPYEVIG